MKKEYKELDKQLDRLNGLDYKIILPKIVEANLTNDERIKLLDRLIYSYGSEVFMKGYNKKH